MTTKRLISKLYKNIFKPVIIIIFDLLIYQYCWNWHSLFNSIPKSSISINLSLDTIVVSAIFLLIELIINKYSSQVLVQMSNNKNKAVSVNLLKTTCSTHLNISEPTIIYILIGIKNINMFTNKCRLKVKFPKFVKAICNKQVTDKNNCLYFNLNNANERLVRVSLLPNGFLITKRIQYY